MSNVNMQKYGKVAVLMGGSSGEREISLKSGAAVLQALTDSGVDAHGLDVSENILTHLVNGNFDRAFIALHGCGGEDGTIQGGLETIGMPYTGSKVMASSLCMNKLVTKKLWQSEKLTTPQFVTIENQSYSDIEQQLGPTFVVKPSNEGSSLGIHKISDQQAFASAVEDAGHFQGQLMAEQWIEGAEYTVGVLNDQPLPVIRLQTPHEFYDYDAKYQSNDTEYVLPCGLDESLEQDLQQVALKAFAATHASGWGRVDVMMDKQNNFWLLEVNTVPGMTDHSLVPMAAAHCGIDFQELVLSILDTSFSTDC